MSNPFEIAFDEDPELELDVPIFERADAAAEEPEEPVLVLEHPVVFPAWRPDDEFESMTSPEGQRVVLRLDEDADLTKLLVTISYWPAEFVVPLDPTDGLWSEEAAIHYAQVTVEEAGEDYIPDGVEWKTVRREEGVIELGRYERNEEEHVVVLLELDGHQSVAFCAIDEGEETYSSLQEFDDFDPVERSVVDMVF